MRNIHQNSSDGRCAVTEVAGCTEVTAARAGQPGRQGTCSPGSVSRSRELSLAHGNVRVPRVVNMVPHPRQLSHAPCRHFRGTSCRLGNGCRLRRPPWRIVVLKGVPHSECLSDISGSHGSWRRCWLQATGTAARLNRRGGRLLRNRNSGQQLVQLLCRAGRGHDDGVLLRCAEIDQTGAPP